MDLYRLILLAGFGLFLASAIYSVARLAILGHSDHSKPAGRRGPAVAYALTTSMSPLKKESARLHLPTYTAGILFHIGTFLSFALLFSHFIGSSPGSRTAALLSPALLATAACGMGILVKRLSKPSMRMLSVPDDYASNLLVSGFQLLSAAALQQENLIPLLFVYSALLFLYIPVSKLRHTIYFITSRIYLGLIFGRRGVWPPGGHQP